MKKFSTYLLGLSFLSILFMAFSASADEYKSMIRYDRVWEHISVKWDDATAYYTKFDGPEEINGKTYHRLVTFRKTRFDFDENGQCYLFDTDNNFYRHEGYLREEDGKVYTLVSNFIYSDEGNIGIFYIPRDNDSLPSDLEEKLIYDFTCKEGDTYLGLNIAGQAEEMTYTVKSIDSVEIDGEEHHCLIVSPKGHENIELKMVEGIGIDSEYGCLTYINFLYIPSNASRDYRFSRVLTMDGTVLYPLDRNGADIPYGDTQGIDLISQPTKNTAPIFDVLGRRISNPAPGQLYIQSGKKHIAR